MTTVLTLWFALSLILALWGISREIGFFGTLIVSLLLTPLAGLVFVLLSPVKVRKSGT